MKFGKLPLTQCDGAILSHSIGLENGSRIKKGVQLSITDLQALEQEGHSELLVAVLEPNDIGENEAASRIARCLEGSNVRAANAGTGRVNLYSTVSGLFGVQKMLIDQINNVHPDITLATLADNKPVHKDAMVATVKIIPYAVTNDNVSKVEAICEKTVIEIAEFKAMKVGVVLSELPTLKESVKKKTVSALEARLAPTGSKIISVSYVDHNQKSIEQAMADAAKKSDIVIVFGASAISDLGDLIPQALLNLGGKIERFGMPVDPGNLLLLGSLGEKMIIGAPGCARSIAENGFDFVLQRILCAREISSSEIANMGVGGLLLEIPSRPSPRENMSNKTMKVAGIVLAAGQSRRMGSENKLVAKLKNKALVRHVVDACGDSNLSNTIVVTGHQQSLIANVLAGSNVQFTQNENFDEGLSSSLKQGIATIGNDFTHALVMLGDMPKVSAMMINKMIEAVSKNPSGSIIMATSNGKRGNPILWPRQYFDRLNQLSGDVGAKHLLFEYAEQIIEVELGEAAALDVDTKVELEALGGSFSI